MKYLINFFNRLVTKILKEKFNRKEILSKVNRSKINSIEIYNKKSIKLMDFFLSIL